MSTQSEIQSIRDIVDTVDDNKVARFAYTEVAFTGNDIEGVSSFDVNAEQNIPDAASTDVNDTILGKGLRTQGASLPRNAFNHYFGRTSYNLNKLTQKFLEFLTVDLASRASDLHEYDPSAKYLTGAMCYIVGTGKSSPSVSIYMRVSSAPTELQGIAPTNTTHWVNVSYNMIGSRRKYSTVDLSGYPTSTWYPVVTTLSELGVGIGAADAVGHVVIEAFCNGAVAGFTNNQRCDLLIESKFPGVSSAADSDNLIDASMVDLTDGTVTRPTSSLFPIGFSKLPIGKQAVVWLKGGSVYGLWNSFGSAFTLYTGAYGNGVDSSIAPVTSYPGVVCKPVPCRAVPIGFVYTQYPGMDTPAALFPNTTWTNISSNFAGAFFRSEGGAAAAFGGGSQSAQNLTHAHTASAGTETANHLHSGSTGYVSSDHSHSISVYDAGNHSHLAGGAFVPSDNPCVYGYAGGYGAADCLSTGSNTGTAQPYVSTGGSHAHGAGSGGISVNHYHGFTTGTESAAHSHSITIADSGGSDLRPLNYTVRVWKRSA